MPAWYRFYNEAIDDRKLKRVARDADQPFALVLGCWSILLALANNDHMRGYLMLSEDTPFSRADLMDEIGQGMNDDVTSEVLLQLENMNLIAFDLDARAYYLPAFTKRQFESDSSAERVRAFRQRQRAKDETESQPDGNVSETLQDRFGNAPETETDAETETETDAEAETDAGRARDGPAAAVSEQEQDVLTLLESVPRIDMAVVRRKLPRWNLAHVPGWVAVGLNAPEAIAAPLVVSRLDARDPPPKDDGDRRRFIEGEYSDYIQH